MSDSSPRIVLQRIAHRVMEERGLAPDFSPAALSELNAINPNFAGEKSGARDLRNLLWCSIDNEESRDLDQLTVAEALPDGAVRILVALADVAALVPMKSALDEHAHQNTTSVYTAAQVFPMLPEKLSTDLTSLNYEADRRALIVEMVFARDGTMTGSGVYEALVRNRARLSYQPVADWLDGAARLPAAIEAVNGLAENIRAQDAIAGVLRAQRHTRGALSFETTQARPVFAGSDLADLQIDRPNRAKKLIEDFMIAANGVTATFLATHRFASIRRVVRSPKRWDRIVELAAARAVTLPAAPDAKALEKFLTTARIADPLHFADLSLSVIKLLGAGEYVLEVPGEAPLGHFGLAVKDYAHSTAPNRRYPDLITHRLLKAALAGERPPYSNSELEALAAHCTTQEDAARKVERQVAKSAAAILLAPKIGMVFDALVTGAAEKGTWVRLVQPPVEGKLARGCEGCRVGDRLRVRLTHVDVERGFLDFAAVR